MTAMNAPSSPLSSLAEQLDPQLAEPLYRQLHARIRDAVLAGQLALGARLPSSRVLAAELGLARGTVALAYELLAAEGFLVGLGAAGTRVNPNLPVMGRPHYGGNAVPTSPEAIREEAMAVPLRMGLPALDLFPRKLWSRLAARQARLLPAETLDYGVSRGLPALRRAIVSYLSISRGIVCDPGQVFITAGYQGALRLIGTALLQPGDQVWHEDPGYFRAREALALMGMDMVPVPVDDEGLVVEQGMALAPQARLALVTPSHQAPLGMALSLPRRLALLAWAAQHGGWIVEDDYDSEFRYVGRPLPALKSLDSQGRVLYAGTFSKVLFPGLASGYLVVPAALVDAFTHAAQLTGSAPSPLVQGTIAAFLEEGHFTRHIRNMRSAYAERRAALARALERHASDHMRVELKEGGMHLVGWLSGGDDIVAVQRLHAQGLLPAALSPWGVSCRPAPALLMSFTNVAPAQAETMAARVAAALLSST
jgi:GntR family transcriptional regulator/MocR family aminotransferase